MFIVSYFFIFKIVPRYPCKLLANAIQTDCSIYEGTWCRSAKSGVQSVGAQSVGGVKGWAQSMGARSVGAQSIEAQSVGCKRGAQSVGCSVGAQSVEAQNSRGGGKVWGRIVRGRKLWGAQSGYN